MSAEEWLAVLRIGVGLWWLESVRHKDLWAFLRGSAMNWVEDLARDHPVRPYGRMIESMSLSTQRRRVVTSWLVVLGEFSVGISLTFGIVAVVGLVVGIFLNLNYLMLAGWKDQGEQGQNLMMILAQAVCLGSGTAGVWALTG